MGSFKRNGRNPKPNRRRGDQAQNRRGIPRIESLENRTLLTGGPTWHPLNTNLADVRNGPMANEGVTLIDVYQDFLHNGGNTSQLASQFPLLRFQGNSVGISVNGYGSFNTFKNSLISSGMTVTNASLNYELVVGWAPISDLPTIAKLPQILDATPNYKAQTKFVGAGDNEAEKSLMADVARTQFGVDGTGVTVGVLSDSVSEVGNGLADSVKTGDLPNNVKVIQDDPNGPGTDEGRAMLENIHDIAPGAALQFATGDTGELGFQQNIEALAAAGSQLISDDLGYADEPYFQDGLIAQGVNAVSASGVSYFSAAGNQANYGYLSNFRGVTATPTTALGSGTYQNFDPGSGVTTELPLTVPATSANGFPISATNPATITFQFDQPYATQQPASSTAAPTSEVDFYILDSAGNIVATGNNNNVATRAPIQMVQITAGGSYFAVIKVVSGPNPGHVEFTDTSETADVIVSKQFGTGAGAGGTYYPTSVGHETAQNTIGIGAVPWWAPAPYLNTNPLNSESFSSTGPAVYVFNANGTPLASPVLTLSPVVSGPDGGNTSFFGQVIDTSNKPPFAPGEPSTPTNLSQNLPSFFGTSSATPNVEAVAALMLQKTPGLAPAQIRAALIASAQPLNGSAQGTWDAQGGFGLVNAVKAVNAVSQLQVLSTVPASGSIVTTPPTELIVTFSKPVVFSTIAAADLAFQTFPSSITSFTVGKPIAVDNPTDPTVVAFPFTFTVNTANGQTGNGKFTYKIQGPITAQDGNKLIPFNGSFTLNDTQHPKVSNVTIDGRIITVQFTEPLAPNTVTPANFFLTVNPGSGPINLDNDPRFVLSYNPLTATVTMDYTGLNQVQMPSGVYKITVKDSVTNLVGNPLDGAFSGVFPSGNGANPLQNFSDNLGFLSVTAPIITSFGLAPASDSGIKGDQNTNINTPTFIGQVFSSFPGTLAGLTVLAEFNSLHGGNLDLNTLNGRGSTGSFDVSTTTTATGSFTLTAPLLPEGYTQVRLVVIGQPDAPPLPGLSTAFNSAFRVDKTPPAVTAATLAPGGAPLPSGVSGATPLAALTSLSLNVVDTSNPTLGPLATPTQILFPAIDPTTASNISNYSLELIDPSTDKVIADESNFISTAVFTPTASNFTSVPNRTSSSQPYFGRIDLTFAPGLPKGTYQLTAHTKETVTFTRTDNTQFSTTFGGLTDAAANPLDDTNVPGQGSKDFNVFFNLQPQPVFVESVSSNATNAQGNTLLPLSYFEINPRAGDIVSAPPTSYFIDFSNPLTPGDYSNAIQLIRSANNASAAADGNFGTLGVAGLGSSGTGFTRVNPAGTTVTLSDGQYGKNTRLTLTLPSGFVLPADHYRLYIPNGGTTAIKDIYNNQLDGEFLGNPISTANANFGTSDLNGNPLYEDLQPTGQYRLGMSGDGVAGGAFMAGFEVVPTGNIIYARPDYSENPLLPSTEATGTITNPYQVLAPQAAPNSLNSSTLNNGDPNGGLNSSVNFLSGFNPEFDRAGIGQFARSAFYAASQLSSRGPVVIVALPAIPQRDPITGIVSSKTFVLQAPAGSDPVANDGSGSVPFDTTLTMQPGSTLKLENASLFVQNQGSALQTLGGPNPNQQVTFTSYADDTIAGDTNGDGSNTKPQPGDWGGIVFRNFDMAVNVASNGNPRSDVFPVDGTLTQGPNGPLAIAGEDDSLSSINFSTVRYGGGAVPATRGVRYDQIDLYNSRPSITNDTIQGSPPGSGTFGSQAGLAADVDSLREDDTARGVLVRRTSVTNTSINGIWIRPLIETGVAEPTDAVPLPDNPVTLGGVANYTLDSTLPYVLTSPLNVGQISLSDTAGNTQPVMNRLYIQPGMMVKSEPGAGIRVVTAGSSLIVGDRTYIAGWDALATTDPTTGLPVSNYAPLNIDGTPNVNFKPNTTGDARVLFTSTNDNSATTSFFDPLTGLSTTVVAALNVLNTPAGTVPTPGTWGGISYQSGAAGTFDEAIVQYAGGQVNIPGGATTHDALAFTGALGNSFQIVNGQLEIGPGGLGTRVSVTNNNFLNNLNAPISETPDGLRAGDTLRPLTSGAPFFRGNILQGNSFNALEVFGSVGNGNREIENVDVDSLWDSTDITYLVRGSIVMGPAAFNYAAPVPSTSALVAEPKPSVVLTVQSALAGTLMPNGTTIPKPGESVIIKLDNNGVTPPPTSFYQTPNISSEDAAGAGFEAGWDNGVDPTADPYVDVGAGSQMRFLGIGGNQTTGQQRIPVIITSIHDSTVGTTVRGVTMNQVVTGDTKAPAAGDGGLILFGGNELPNYNVLDPRAGSLIDNVDIKYITRMEMQGGGVIAYEDLNASNSFDTPDDEYSQKAGSFPPLVNGQPNPLTFAVQANAEHALMISNSNLSNFLQDGVIEHPGYNELVSQVLPGIAGQPPFVASAVRSGVAGEPNFLFLVNDTVSNMPVAVQVIGDPNSDNNNSPEPNELVLLNNTFYNDTLGFDLEAIQLNFGTPQVSAAIQFVAMDNIIDGSTTAIVQASGMIYNSELQYNLFFNDGPVMIQGPGPGVSTGVPGGIQQVGNKTGDPLFRNAATGDFRLQKTSPAIDASRSELNLYPDTGPINILGTNNSVTVLLPIVNQALDSTGGVRNQTTRTPLYGQLDPATPPTDELTLPGYPLRGFVDQFVAVLPSNPKAVAGPDTVPGGWEYMPIDGERDALGYLRVDDPNVSDTGAGSRPFFDIGAYEFVDFEFNAPKVTAVQATIPNTVTPGTTQTINLYSVGGFAGTNQPIQTIDVFFNRNVDPATLTGSTILLQGSGGDGIFGNGNSPTDKFYNLSGKVTYNAAQNELIINVGAAGLTLGNDKYRLTLLGTGSNVIADPQGDALDGINTLNDDPNNPQLALPSGSGVPGTNFYTTFIINTTAPTVVPFSFTLSNSTDSNIVGDKITKINKPTFVGKISTPLSAIVPLAGQTVILDVSTAGNGVYDRLNAGTALTDAQGNFAVTVGTDGANTGLVTNTNGMGDSPYTVGPDGKLNFLTGDGSGFSHFRIRVIDQSGNASDQPTDPESQFLKNNALAGAVIDTAPPHVTNVSPTPNTTLTVAAGTPLPFSFTTDKNIDPASLNTTNLVLTSAGPDGILGTKDDVNIPIDVNSITPTYLKNGPKGPEQIAFATSAGVPNGLYELQLEGDTSSPIRDLAGNALGGGVDFDSIYVVHSTSSVLYVGDPAVYQTNPLAATGLRANPYPTITAALAAAVAGDVIGVLPGVYTESITLKPYVRILSSDPSSSGSNFIIGNAQQTVIRAPAKTTSASSLNITVNAQNIPVIAGAFTELAGLSIASPLNDNGNDPAFGPIDPFATAIRLSNADVLIDRDYIVDAGIGIDAITSGSNAPEPDITTSGIIGNTYGVVVNDSNGTTVSLAKLVNLYNNDIAFNTIGVLASEVSNAPLMVSAANNIFWQNHDLTTARNGFGIVSSSLDKVVLRSNMFQGNGASDTKPTFAAVNIGNGFDPLALSTTPDSLGNFVGNPAFVAPRDPRPGSDGPATFFLDANFDLTLASNAINAANETYAPSVDFLFRKPVVIPGKGFPGTGPASVGAFYPQGKGGTTVGGAFRVASTSLSPIGAAQANGISISSSNLPTSITVTFSQNVNSSTVSASDLVLSGSGISAFGGARSTGVTFTDPHTAVFSISKGFNNTGTVNVSIGAGAIKSTGGAVNLAFKDWFTISSGITQSSVPVAPASAPTSTAAPTAAASTSVPNVLTVPLATTPLVPAPTPTTPTTTAHVPHGPKVHPRRFFPRPRLFKRG